MAGPVLIAAAFVAASSAGAGADGASGRQPPTPGGIGVLAGPARALKVATLDLPQPIGTGLPAQPAASRPGAPQPAPTREDAARAGANRADLPAQPASPRVLQGAAIVTASLTATAPSSAGPGAPAAYAAPEALAAAVAGAPVAEDLAPAADGAGVTASDDDAFAFPPPLVMTESDPRPVREVAGQPHLELALDLLLELPLIQDNSGPIAEDAAYGPDRTALREAPPHDALPAAPSDPADDGEILPAAVRAAAVAAAEVEPALHHDPVAVFGRDPNLFPALAFEYHALADKGFVPLPAARPAETQAIATSAGPEAVEAAEDSAPDGIWPSPAQRLSLAGEQLARAQKCLAEAIYFESRGEPKRGQIAVAQVVVNRVFSGYYPADVCGAVYQNAHRHLACQFTFACDDVRDVVREPDMWVQAKEIAADMLDGKLWLTSVGRATHYHAYWVHPSWVREMRKLDRIGVHTFYRPRRWGEG